MAAVPGAFSMEILRGRENFDVWKRQAKSCLIIKKCWSVIEKQGALTQEEVAVDQRALAEVTLMIDPCNYGHIANAKTSKEAWDALMKAYEDTGLTRKVELLKQLVGMKLENCSSVQEYVNQTIMLALKVNNAGLNIDDELTASLMLAGLTEEFKPLVMAVENSKGKLTVDAVKNLLLQDAKFDQKKNENGGAALYSKNKNGRKRIQCYNCKEFGHISKNCQKEKMKEYKNNGFFKRNNKNASATLIARTTVGLHVAAEVSKAEFAGRDDAVHWYVDSGASNHMISVDKYMYNKQKIDNKKVLVANNGELIVDSSGNIDIEIFNGKKEKMITIENVEYVPNLCANLLSVKQMTSNGKKVIFEDDQCKIFDADGNIVAIATAQNDLYCLESKACIPKEKVFVVENFELWHRRMGHICNKILHDVKNANLGVNFADGNKDLCETCLQGKQTRNPSREQGTRATHLLQLVHSDVVGPLKTNSFSGARFLVTFVDDYSRKVFVYPLQRKSDVFETFLQFKKIAENQCGEKIKILRTDNGGEYLSKMFSTYLKDCGIVHQKSCPYTPEQNGVAERLNRTIIERVRCMLIDSGLDHRFWAEAANTASFLINRTPCRGNICSPEEVWSGSRPNLKFLKVFGCPAYVHVPKEKRKKLDPKSIRCIMVGYSGESKAYRLFNPQDQKVIISRDVVFLENEKATSAVVSERKRFGEWLEYDNESVNSGECDSNELTTNLADMPNDEDESDSSSTIYEESEGWPPDVQMQEENVDDEYTPNRYQNQLLPAVEDVRRSDRIANRNQQSQNFCAIQFVSGDPESVEEAMSSTNSANWKSAMKKEVDSLVANGTWELIKLPQGEKAIKSRWVFRTKPSQSGTQFKARLVAKGFSQRYGIDFNETFAPVVRYQSLRYLMSLAVQHDLHIHQMDAVSAYLNGILKETVYMEQPEAFGDGTGRVCKLVKSIYGLKQSGRVWNETLNQELLKMGLERGEVDQCIYRKFTGDNMLFVAIYVDDVLIFSNDLKEIKSVKKRLASVFKMKDIGEVSSVLGMRITKGKNSIKIDQSHYIKNVLSRFGMMDCNPVATPMDYNQKLSQKKSPDHIEGKYHKEVPYMQAIGCLLFAAQITRPDICYAVNVLSRFSSNPGKPHWEAVKRIMRYLKGTIDKGIVYKKQPDDELKGFCDADWAGDIDDRKSTSGYVFIYQSGAVSWATQKQKTVALSSTEAEFMSVTAAIKEAVWLKRLERELNPKYMKTTTLFCDNKGAIQVALNNNYSPRTKHVDIKAKFIQQKIEEKEVVLQYICTNEMIADIFTKAVTPQKLNYFNNLFGLQ